MDSHPHLSHTADEVLALRQQAGRWIKTLREAANLSQRDLSKLLGLEYYTFISQIESGRGKVPPAQYLAFAKALGVPAKGFVKTLIKFYEPITHYALFEADDEEVQIEPTSDQQSPSVIDLAERIARLEMLLDPRSL